MWHYGMVNVAGDPVETAWRVRDGVATHIELFGAHQAGLAVTVEGASYQVAYSIPEQLPDRVAVPLTPLAEIEAAAKAMADAKAKAKADFEGKPWPPVEPKKKAAASGE